MIAFAVQPVQGRFCLHAMHAIEFENFFSWFSTKFDLFSMILNQTQLIRPHSIWPSASKNLKTIENCNLYLKISDFVMASSGVLEHNHYYNIKKFACSAGKEKKDENSFFKFIPSILNTVSRRARSARRANGTRKKIFACH